MTEAVAKMLKKSTDLSDSNLVRNVNGLWSKKSFSDEDSIEWIGKTKQKDFQRINLKYHICLGQKTLPVEVCAVIYNI